LFLLEFILPCSGLDLSYNFNFTMNISIGFCGDSSHGRKKYLDMLNDSNIQNEPKLKEFGNRPLFILKSKIK